MSRNEIFGPGGCGGMTYPDQYHKKLFIQLYCEFVNNLSDGQFELTLILHIFL